MRTKFRVHRRGGDVFSCGAVISLLSFIIKLYGGGRRFVNYGGRKRQYTQAGFCLHVWKLKTKINGGRCLPYNHTVWLCVLMGSVCHFIAVLGYALPIGGAA